MDDEISDDPLDIAPVFFLSYARPVRLRATVVAPYEMNRFVPRLFTDLSAHVNELIPLPPGRDPGFMDTAIIAGNRWSQRLLEAAGACQVFIPLLSPHYVGGSTWCAMEWDIFTQRRVVSRRPPRSAGESPVVPILWVPTDDDTMPAEIAELNRFSPPDLPNANFLPAYEANGLYGLLTMAMEDAYQAFVWKLAQHVQRIYGSYWVKPEIPPDIKGLRTAFDRRELG